MKGKPSACKSCCGKKPVATVSRKDILDKLYKTQAVFEKLLEKIEEVKSTQRKIDLISQLYERGKRKQ